MSITGRNTSQYEGFQRQFLHFSKRHKESQEERKPFNCERFHITDNEKDITDIFLRGMPRDKILVIIKRYNRQDAVFYAKKESVMNYMAWQEYPSDKIFIIEHSGPNESLPIPRLVQIKDIQPILAIIHQAKLEQDPPVASVLKFVPAKLLGNILLPMFNRNRYDRSKWLMLQLGDDFSFLYVHKLKTAMSKLQIDYILDLSKKLGHFLAIRLKLDCSLPEIVAVPYLNYRHLLIGPVSEEVKSLDLSLVSLREGELINRDDENSFHETVVSWIYEASTQTSRYTFNIKVARELPDYSNSRFHIFLYTYKTDTARFGETVTVPTSPKQNVDEKDSPEKIPTKTQTQDQDPSGNQDKSSEEKTVATMDKVQVMSSMKEPLTLTQDSLVSRATRALALRPQSSDLSVASLTQDKNATGNQDKSFEEKTLSSMPRLPFMSGVREQINSMTNQKQMSYKVDAQSSETNFENPSVSNLEPQPAASTLCLLIPSTVILWVQPLVAVSTIPATLNVATEPINFPTTCIQNTSSPNSSRTEPHYLQSKNLEETIESRSASARNLQPSPVALKIKLETPKNEASKAFKNSELIPTVTASTNSEIDKKRYCNISLCPYSAESNLNESLHTSALPQTDTALSTSNLKASESSSSWNRVENLAPTMDFSPVQIKEEDSDASVDFEAESLALEIDIKEEKAENQPLRGFMISNVKELGRIPVEIDQNTGSASIFRSTKLVQCGESIEELQKYLAMSIKNQILGTIPQELEVEWSFESDSSICDAYVDHQPDFLNKSMVVTKHGVFRLTDDWDSFKPLWSKDSEVYKKMLLWKFKLEALLDDNEVDLNDTRSILEKAISTINKLQRSQRELESEKDIITEEHNDLVFLQRELVRNMTPKPTPK